MIKRFASMLCVAGMVVFFARPAAAAVEYVKICSLYGAGFYYIPGTDTCYNVGSGETRQATEGGVWFNTYPSEPIQWVANAAAACVGGTLVNTGTLQGSSFALNSYNKFEAPLQPITLGQSAFVERFLMSGDLNRVGTAAGTIRFTGVDSTEIPPGTEVATADGVKFTTVGDFLIGDTTSGQVDVTAIAEVAGSTGIMTAGTTLTLTTAITDVDPTSTVISGFSSVNGVHSDLCIAFHDAAGVYVPLGCEDLAKLDGQAATIAFTPRHPTPTPALTTPIGLVASGRDWGVNPTFEGQLTVSACVRNTADTGVPDSPGSPASPSCTVADSGNGTATMTCPDGTSVSVLTRAPAIKDSGCNSVPESSGLLVAAAALFQMLRYRRQTRRA